MNLIYFLHPKIFPYITLKLATLVLLEALCLKATKIELFCWPIVLMYTKIKLKQLFNASTASNPANYAVSKLAMERMSPFGKISYEYS